MTSTCDLYYNKTSNLRLLRQRDFYKTQTVQHFPRGRANRRCLTLAFPGFLLPLDVMATLAESASVGATDLRAFFRPLPLMASGRAA